MTYRICFVCMGNICRSPTAELVMRAKLEDAGLADQVEVDSAGTGGWHAGDPADERALEMLREHGYPHDGHVARQFRSEWFGERDLVLAMDSENLRALDRMAPAGAESRLALLRGFDPASVGGDLDVPDPYYGGPEGFERVLELVEAACDGLIEHLSAELASSDD